MSICYRNKNRGVCTESDYRAIVLVTGTFILRSNGSFKQEYHDLVFIVLRKSRLSGIRVGKHHQGATSILQDTGATTWLQVEEEGKYELMMGNSYSLKQC